VAATHAESTTACRCKPKKCKQECKKSCPVVKVGEWVYISFQNA
jgi:translation initiation factor RLI1